jgi:hypothetical protein
MIRDLVKLGSETAKNGFKNEDIVIKKFKDWKTDTDSQNWLKLMSYSLSEIKKVDAIKLHGFKTDVQIKITIYLEEAIHAENISVKLVSNPKGFNQIDKRWVDKYAELWDMPKDIIHLLKLFTGEIKSKKIGLKDERRMFLSEMNVEDATKILDFFKKNKILIIADILKGRGKFSAGWMLVALKDSTSAGNWTVKSMNHVMNYFGNGEVSITARGSLQIGRITMQRKGGDGGRKTANMLQFKINPAELFENHT